MHVHLILVYRVSNVLSDSACICSNISVLGSQKVGLKSCIYYCDDRAVQSVFEKDQLSDNVSYHQTASCNLTSRKLKSCNQCCMLGLLMNFEKSHSLLPFIFRKGNNIVNTKLVFSSCKYPKNGFFQHISRNFLTFNIWLCFFVANQLARFTWHLTYNWEFCLITYAKIGLIYIDIL